MLKINSKYSQIFEKKKKTYSDERTFRRTYKIKVEKLYNILIILIFDLKSNR